MRTLPSLVLLGLSFSLLASCDRPSSPPPPAPSPPPSGPAPNPVSPDWSTPDAAIATFVAACRASDAALVSSCFAKSCDGEFRGILNGTDPKIGEFMREFATAQPERAARSRESKEIQVAGASWLRGDRIRRGRFELILEQKAWKLLRIR
jgi:hypothetical protein